MSVTEVRSMVTEQQEVRACLLLHPSSPQFRGVQREDVPSWVARSRPGDQTWGQDEVLCWRIQLATITACLQLSATAINICPVMGYPRSELDTAARNPAQSLQGGSQSRTAGSTPCPPACP